MSSIRLQSATQVLTSDAPRSFLVGRETGCDLVSTDATVSRRHAEIRAVGDGWEVVDLGSTHGTWVNGQRVQQAPLVGTMGLRFGEAGGGLDVTVTVTAGAAPVTNVAPPVDLNKPGQPAAPGFPPPAAPPMAPPPMAPPPMAPPPMAPPAAPPVDRPAAAFSPNPPPGLGVTMVTDGPVAGFGGPVLLVRTRHEDLRFPPTAPVRIGRDPNLEVTCDDPVVSRLHVVLHPGPKGWQMVDQSTAGTFVEGERVTQRAVDEPTEVLLGHPTAGYELELVPVVSAREASAEIASKKRNRVLAMVAACVVVLALIGGSAFAVVKLVGKDDDKGGGTASVGLSKEHLERAKRASVLLLEADASNEVLGNGSGTIIDSERGLILTNSHVAQPSKQPGNDGEDPDHLQVALTSENDDTPAKPAYWAKPIVTDGVLDLSIVQIYADAEGNPIDQGDLNLPEAVPVGDSSKLETGDNLTALGYPALTASNLQGDFATRELSVTTGIVSTLIQDVQIGEPRSWIDSDVRIGSGNSGGASINDDGEIVGVNSAVKTANTTQGQAGEFTSGSALIRPIDYAKPLIDVAEQGGDPDYTSPYQQQMQTLPQAPTTEATFTSGGWGTESSSDCSGSSTLESPQTLTGVTAGATVYAYYAIAGLEDGTAFGIRHVTRDGTEINTQVDRWSFGSAPTCIYVPFTVPDGIDGVDAQFLVGDSGTVVADNPVNFE